MPHPPATLSQTLFVRGVPRSLMADKLTQVASKYGRIINTHVPLGMGIAFIDMATVDEALLAIDGLDESTLHGRKLNVEVSNPPTKHVVSGVETMVTRIKKECAGIFTEDERLSGALIEDFSALILELEHAMQRANPGFMTDCILRVLKARSQYKSSNNDPVLPRTVSGEWVTGSAGSGSGDAYPIQQADHQFHPVPPTQPIWPTLTSGNVSLTQRAGNQFHLIPPSGLIGPITVDSHRIPATGMIGPVLPVLGEHDIIMDRPPEVVVKQICVISGGSVHENPSAGVNFVTSNKFGNSNVGYLFFVLCIDVSKDAHGKLRAEFSDFQLGNTVDVAVNKLPHFYQRAYAGRNIFT